MITINLPISVTVTPTLVTIAVAGQTSTIAVPAAPVTPPVKPPTGWGGVILDSNGMLDPYWGGTPTPSGILSPGGDWSSSGTTRVQATAPDGGKAMLFTATDQWPMWIPHPAAIAGQPSSNGVGVNLAPFTHLVADVYPEAAITLTFIANSVSGTYVGPNAVTTDTLTAKNTPVQLPAGKFTTVSIPLAGIGVPVTGNPAPMWIYKIATQQNSPSTAVPTYMRNVKFI